MINLLPGQKSSASYNHIDLVMQLQIANEDEPLQQHVEERPRNAQYTSRISAVVLLEATDTWLDMKIVDSLKSSPYFSMLANMCVDISTTEQLSIYCRWIMNGKPEGTSSQCSTFLLWMQMQLSVSLSPRTWTLTNS